MTLLATTLAAAGIISLFLQRNFVMNSRRMRPVPIRRRVYHHRHGDPS